MHIFSGLGLTEVIGETIDMMDSAFVKVEINGKCNEYTHSLFQLYVL